MVTNGNSIFLITSYVLCTAFPWEWKLRKCFLQPLSFVGRIPFSSHFIDGVYVPALECLVKARLHQKYRVKQANKQNQNNNSLLLIVMGYVDASTLELSLADLDDVSLSDVWLWTGGKFTLGNAEFSKFPRNSRLCQSLFFISHKLIALLHTASEKHYSLNHKVFVKLLTVRNISNSEPSINM